jgi:Icc-related predicted phosphoesterase
MPLCFFVSDLHGKIQRYQILFDSITKEKPAAVFLGGDLLPSRKVLSENGKDPITNFVAEYLKPKFFELKNLLGSEYPRFYGILGNDDPKIMEPDLIGGEEEGLWFYIHQKKVGFEDFTVYGYANVPPSPFLLKDWEKYDVSRYLDPGCIAPEDGLYTVPNESNKIEFSTIHNDIQELIGKNNLSKAIFLFHAPPYRTNLDRADLDGKIIDHVPVDVHVGSIAIQRLIERYQPLVTLHGHIHESCRLTGSWVEKTGNTYSFSAAHDGPELALVRFDPNQLEKATREHLIR